MEEKTKINFRPFFEEVSNILDQSDIADLKNIIKAMAGNVSPLDRESFIEQISCYRERPARQEHINTDLLDEIDDLKQEIKQMADDPDDEHEYGYCYDYHYYHDEDSLGSFEQYVAEITNLFDEAATAFDYDNFQLAREAYEKLFAILNIEDEYGRGISYLDLESIGPNEARARYLRSVYLTVQSDKRVEAVVKKMSEVKSFGSSRPTIQEVIDISTKPLPDFQNFIKELIDFLTNQNGYKFDFWLREAVRIDSGVAGLERLAKNSGTDHPRAYYDWISVLMKDCRFEDAICAAKYALEKLPEMPIKAAIADLLACAADKINDKESAKEGRWSSFAAKPTLNRLVALLQCVDSSDLSLIMQDSAEVIKTFLGKKNNLYRSIWERDDIDIGSNVPKTLLLHSYMLGQDFESAFQLAKKDKPLGWSGDNCQPFFIAGMFVLASGKKLSKSSERQKTFWKYAVKSTFDDCNSDKIIDDLTVLYENILTQKGLHGVGEYFSWCIKISKKRINEIVINTYRGAYEKAAILTAVCVELFECRNEPKKATAFYSAVKRDFSRYSAFQRELKKVFSK